MTIIMARRTGWILVMGANKDEDASCHVHAAGVVAKGWYRRMR